MEFEALRVTPHEVDDALCDDGQVGPELAYLTRTWQRSPRALIWRNPSPEWQRFVLLLPIASRLSLMGNPIFAQLTRAWGLNIRFLGVDRDGLVYDFRSLLTDATLRRLLECLGHEDSTSPEMLDTLFAALAADMLTVLDLRRRDWGRHLDGVHRLEPEVSGTLFGRDTRYPDFLAGLRLALREGRLDAGLYGRALRTVEARELDVETRVARALEAALDPGTLTLLLRCGTGQHLGAYNWLRIDPPHAPARAHVLANLPGFVSDLAQTLLPLDALRVSASTPTPDRENRNLEGFDLRQHGRAEEDPSRARWAGVLMRAVDAGQDRAVIEALALRFAVSENVIRRLWREAPEGLGQPDGWLLERILRVLQARGDREWPRTPAQWQTLIAHASGPDAD